MYLLMSQMDAHLSASKPSQVEKTGPSPLTGVGEVKRMIIIPAAINGRVARPASPAFFI
jgi:hypothetical protein